MKGIFAIVLSVCLLLSLAACGADGVPEDRIYAPEADGGTFYYYGVEKSAGTYYVRVLREYAEEPSEKDYLYVPLAQELDASFQPEGWVGAWSPNDYATARELAAAHQKGEISTAAKFEYVITGGRMNYLAEYNYYAGNDVTGAQ